MATINGTVEFGFDGDTGNIRITYSNVSASDTCTPFAFTQHADRTVQFIGGWGAGGTAVVEGSLDDGTTYVGLTDPQGNAISKTADAIEAISEVAALTRPRVSAGTGVTAKIVFILRRSQPQRV